MGDLPKSSSATKCQLKRLRGGRQGEEATVLMEVAIEK